MATYRKRPVAVEARQFLPADFDNGPELAKWCGGEYLWDRHGDFNLIAIHTLEGVMHAAAGDWIVKGVEGEFYPVRPDIFAATYELVG